MAKSKSTSKAPAFRFYPKDFLTSERQVAMSAAAAGVYIRLLCHCWLSDTLPGDPIVLAKMGGVSDEEFAAIWPMVGPCFTTNGMGRLVNPRLSHEQKKQDEYSKAQRVSGLRGAKRRWRPRSEPHSDPNGVAIVSPLAKNGSSFSSSSSSSSSLNTLSLSISEVQPSSERVSERGVVNSDPQPTVRLSSTTLEDDELSDRARRLIRRYAELYTEHRHGAKLRLVGNSLEFQDACALVKLWDDARLEKLAICVLTTDDEQFIQKSDRGFRIFAIKASWADSRLAAWEQERLAKA